MKNKNALAFLAAFYTTFVGTAVVMGIRVHREEKRKRDVIRREADLDLAAIARAKRVLSERMTYGPIRNKSLVQIMQEADNEIRFQKIAIREE